MKNQYYLNRTRLLLVILIGLLICVCDLDGAEISSESLTQKTDERFELLKKTNFLVAISERIAISDDDSKCTDDVRVVVDSIKNRDMWSIKLITSFGNIPSSFTSGNSFWFPPKWDCESISHPAKFTLSPEINRTYGLTILNATSPIPLSYLIIYANFTTPFQLEIKVQVEPVLHIGVCLPQSCSKEQVLGAAKDMFEEHQLAMQKDLNITLTPFEVRNPRFASEILSRPSFIILWCFSGVMAGLFCLSHIYHYRWKKAEQKQPPNNSFLSLFNVVKNWNKLYSTSVPPGFLAPIAGLKLLTSLWIFMFHAGMFPAFTFTNSLYTTAVISSAHFQPIFQAVFFVDIFFAVSAILLTYNFLMSEEQMKRIQMNGILQNTLLYMKMVLHRYFRLVPSFAFATLLSTILHTVIDTTTPYYLGPDGELNCEKKWHHNVFFTSNIVGFKDSCMPWTWYLACEMQYFIIFLALLFVYAKNANSAKSLFVFFATVSLAVSYYLFQNAGISFRLDTTFVTRDQVYGKPWTRMNSYLGGVVFGWILYRMREVEFKLNGFVVAMYWLLSAAVFIFASFVTYFANTPTWLAAVFYTFGRLFLGFHIGSIVIMCCKGFGGCLNRFLSSKLFLHFYKLTYAFYLLGPLVQVMFYGSRQTGTNFEELPLIFDILSTMVLLYGFSVFIYIFVELPFGELAKKVFR